MSSSRPVFRSRWLPYVLVAPQLIITLIFFIWPAGEALWYSLQSVDPFGLSSQFVGLDNFVALFHDPYYLDSFWTTIKFSALVTVSGLLISLFFAALVDYVVRGSRFYQTLMLLPYAVAPAVAAVLWIFLFNPGRGRGWDGRSCCEAVESPPETACGGCGTGRRCASGRRAAAPEEGCCPDHLGRW